MKFREDAVPQSSDDLYYGLFDGGYIKPELLLEDGLDLQNVRQAIDTITTFLDKAEAKGLLELV